MGPDAFEYELPPHLIAQAPPPRRRDARLLVVGPPTQHASISAWPELLPAGALVVVNRSAVVPARLHVRRDDGRSFELLLNDPAADQGPGAQVRAWVRPAKRLRVGDVLALADLRLRYDEPCSIDPRARRFTVLTGDVLTTCQAHGEVPLPPYIARPGGPGAEDLDRYQTVFAGPRGSVAAPTAGLHLDDAMMAELDPVQVTLHVGPGTFLPMDVADVRGHRVGAERLEIDEAAALRIEAARAEGRPIVAVGTTVTRALESVASVHGGRIEPTRTTTELVITPGFRFAVVTHLLTNFHLPRSSLLMLVCSLGGRERVLAAYREAVAAGYRFYSYGDAMFVARAEDA